MGNVTADGTQLWLSGRYDHAVYVLSTEDGHLIKQIEVGERAARSVRLAAAGPLLARPHGHHALTRSARKPSWRRFRARLQASTSATVALPPHTSRPR